MANPAGSDPSMEDILSSIRKIISDDDSSGTQAASHVVPGLADTLNGVGTSKTAEHARDEKADVSNTMEATQPDPRTYQNPVEEVISQRRDVLPKEETSESVTSLASIAKAVSASIKDDLPHDEQEEEVAIIGDEALEEAPVIQTFDNETVDVTPEDTSVPEESSEQGDALSALRSDPLSYEEENGSDGPSDIEIPDSPDTRMEVPALQSAVEGQLKDEAAAFKGALMSSATQGSVSNSFDKLKQSTLESIDKKVEQLVRPMLAEWLDNNLPQLVEKLVREEIERITRTPE